MFGPQHPAADSSVSSCSLRAPAKSPCADSVSAKLFIEVSVSGCSGPSTRRWIRAYLPAACAPPPNRPANTASPPNCSSSRAYPCVPAPAPGGGIQVRAHATCAPTHTPRARRHIALPSDEIGLWNVLRHRDHLPRVRHVKFNLFVQPRVFRRFSDLCGQRLDRRCPQHLRASCASFSWKRTARDTSVCTARASCLPRNFGQRSLCDLGKLARCSASSWLSLSAFSNTAVTSDAGIGATASTDARRRKSSPSPPSPRMLRSMVCAMLFS